MDIDDGQLQKANENVEFAELGNRMHLLRASSMGRKPAQTHVVLDTYFTCLALNYWSYHFSNNVLHKVVLKIIVKGQMPNIKK